MNLLELFCGKAEISEAFKEAGHNTFTVDKRFRKGTCEPDLQIDINKLCRPLIPFDKIHCIWASFPCTPFSYGAGNYYYDGKYSKENAAPFIKLVKNTLDFIEECNPDFFFIENPRGKLRYEKLMIDWCIKYKALVKEITLGSYGFHTIKPTDIFTNACDWLPRKKLPFGRGSRNAGKPLTNLTTIQRQSTPKALGTEIVNYLDLKSIPVLKKYLDVI